MTVDFFSINRKFLISQLANKFIFLIFWLTSILGFAQNPLTVTRITTQNGLSQNSVNDILEDRDGYIWLATQDGLNRFNGKNIISFRPNPLDSSAVSDNFISHLVEDAQGYIWMTTRNDINVYDKVKRQFHRVKHPNNSLCINITEINSQIYILYSNEIIIEIWKVNSDVKFTNANTPLDQIATLLPEIDNTGIYKLLIKSDSASFYILTDDKVKKWPDQTSSNSGLGIKQNNHTFYSLSLDSSRVLFADLNGLAMFNSKSRQISLSYPGVVCYDFLRANSSQIWVAAINGVYSMDTSLLQLEQILFKDFDTKNVTFHSLLQDSYGQIWVGSANQGVFVHHPAKDVFQYELNQSLPDQPFVRDVAQFGSIIWMATDRGLIAKQGSLEKVYNPEEKFSGIYVSGNKVFAGTSKGKILYSSDYLSKDEFIEIKLPNEAEIVDFLEVNNDLLIVTYAGLFQLRDNKITRIVELDATIKNYYFLSIFKDIKGIIWLGHSLGASYMGTDRVWHNILYASGDSRSPNYNFISDFANDINGDLWMATYGGGLSKMNSDSTFTHFTEKDGLPNNVIHGMVADQQGMFWLTSNAGITRFSPITYSSVNYDITAGLQSCNFPISGIVQGSKGTILAGTDKGCLSFNPTKVPNFDLPPKLIWTDLFINFLPRTDYLSQSEIKLNYDQNEISLSFDGLKLDLPLDVQYSYLMKGLSENWITIPYGQQTINFHELPYRKYEITLMAKSKNGHFKPVAINKQIQISPPFWLRWYFIVLTSLGILIALTLMTIYFSRKRLKSRIQELEMREKVRWERERISRDLHDSVGTHLAFMISKLDFLLLTWSKDNISDKKDYVMKLTEFSRSGMRMLRETIWVLNQEKVESAGIKRKIEEYLVMSTSDQQVQYEIVFKAQIQFVKSSIALNLFRIIQEAVSNSLRHGLATHISIEIKIDSNEHLSVVIKDNGKGFDLAENQKNQDHFGLSNMQSRAKELGLGFQIQSNTNGTQINLS